MSISVARNDSTSDGTILLYDIVGAATSPFDVDSGGQTGNQTSQVNSFTTCSSCLTPSAPHELIIANQGQNWCTSTASPSPGGSLFDAATYTGTSVNGPQSVDQNNGWFHYYDPNANPITVTWTNSCSQAEGVWAGRVAAFKSGSSTTQQPAPPHARKLSSTESSRLARQTKGTLSCPGYSFISSTRKLLLPVRSRLAYTLSVFRPTTSQECLIELCWLVNPLPPAVQVCKQIALEGSN